jgi:hypothetical protein
LIGTNATRVGKESIQPKQEKVAQVFRGVTKAPQLSMPVKVRFAIHLTLECTAHPCSVRGKGEGRDS